MQLWRGGLGRMCEEYVLSVLGGEAIKKWRILTENSEPCCIDYRYACRAIGLWGLRERLQYKNTHFK